MRGVPWISALALLVAGCAELRGEPAELTPSTFSDETVNDTTSPPPADAARANSSTTPSTEADPPVRRPAVSNVTLRVQGEVAHGLVARPNSTPRAVIVLLHGYGHSAEDHRAHLDAFVAAGLAAVAMDYRHAEAGFPLRAGADDTIAGAATVAAEYPDAPRILLSVSMGTAVAAMVLAEQPIYDYWVDAEGLANLAEEWAAAAGTAAVLPFSAQAKREMEAECGGPPATARACYNERSAALRASEYAHLRGAIVIHAVNDGVVPFTQAPETVTALRDAGIPTDFRAVLRGEPGGEGTTATLVPVDGLAGHASEDNDAHTITRLAIATTIDLATGAIEPPADRDDVVDRELPP